MSLPETKLQVNARPISICFLVHFVFVCVKIVHLFVPKSKLLITQLHNSEQVWFSNRRSKNRRNPIDSGKHSKGKKINKTSNGCPANSTGEDTNSSGSPSSNGTNGTASNLADEKPFVVSNISALNQTEAGHHSGAALANGANGSTNSALANTLGSNALDANALTNDFNRARDSTLISLAARINSAGFNTFYPGLHSDSYG